MITATLKIILGPEEFDVVICADPEKALALVAERDFAVVISDNSMPQMLGLDFLAECRRIRPRSARMLLTGVLEMGPIEKAAERGDISRFITKPWLGGELLAAVREAIQNRDLAVRKKIAPGKKPSPRRTPAANGRGRR